MAELLCNGRVIVPQVEIPVGFLARSRGLLGRESLDEGCGMYFGACNAIHTFFMRFPLDLVFFDRRMSVIRLVSGVSPFRTVFGGLGAASVIELQSGWLGDALKKGDVVDIKGMS